MIFKLFHIIPLFHFYSRAKNYSKTPQNGIEIISFGDPVDQHQLFVPSHGFSADNYYSFRH
jgi:hypothetical protein